MDRTDPIYLLGLYEAKFAILRRVFRGNNLYLTTDSMAIARAVLGYTEVPALDSLAEPPPVGPPSGDDLIPI